MQIPPTSPGHPAPKPPPVSPKGEEPLSSEMANSPFAKMFAQTGALPTAKELQQIINGILKDQLLAIKKGEERWKASMKKLKDTIEGNES
jgi:hypothetical protein